MTCTCDLPTCATRNPICIRLAELRIAHRVVTQLAAERWQNGAPMNPDIATMLANIESECEILVK